MCYSAKIQANYREYVRRYGADMDIDTFLRLFFARAAGNDIKIPKAVDAAFDGIDEEITAAIAAYRSQRTRKLETNLFEQRTRPPAALRRHSAGHHARIPQTCSLCATVAGRQHWQRRVVSINLAAGQRGAAHGVDQRCEQRLDATHPIPHRARIDSDGVTRVHHRFAVQGEMVRELRHGDVSAQRWSRDAPIDRAARGRSLRDAITARVVQLRTAMTDHTKVRTHVFGCSAMSSPSGPS
ncbi:hypothetical protein BSE24067_03723 [Burkholderia seminalis]|nr:hypothetical protein BSE24067_03723 [Burkholderia seminalis]